MCLGILIWQLNTPSAFAGAFITVAFVPLQLYYTKQFAKIRTMTATKTDSRVRSINEVFAGISCVKSYAWEAPFFDRITAARDLETGSIHNAFKIKSINQALYYFVPPLAAFVTFSTYRATGGTLTLPLIFSSLGLLLVLRASIGRHFTQALETGSEAFASANRIDAFFDLADTKTRERGFLMNKDEEEGGDEGCVAALSADDVELVDQQPKGHTTAAKNTDAASSRDEDPLVRMQGEFRYSAVDPAAFALRGLDVRVDRKELVMVVGKVGAGKSSLMAAMLGNLTSGCAGKGVSADEGTGTSRKVTLSKAYVAQSPWIMAASIRQNVILAGAGGGGTTLAPLEHEMEWPLYAQSLQSCRLVEDMDEWPAYDMTEIGERGLSISGGQKARVSLARAVYSDRELMLLDEPLGAVDARTGKALFFECILPLRDAGKGVVLVTHQLQYLPHADKIVVLDQGRQAFVGTFAELDRRRAEFGYLDIPALASSATDAAKGAVGGLRKSRSGILATRFFEKSKSDVALLSEQQRQQAAIIVEEDRNVGTIEGGLWWNYLRRGGKWHALLALLSLLVSQALMLMTDYWLRWWSEEEFGDQSKDLYVWVYAILVSCCILMGYLRARHFFAYSLRTSTSLHNDALKAVIRAPLTFYNANPAGRILNRFAKDQNQIDELFPFIAYDCAQNISLCVSSLCLVVVAMPWAAVLLPFLVYYFIKMRTAYVMNSRELKRMEAVSRSPIYADFSATLDGIETLLAYDLEGKMAARFSGRLETNARAWFSFLMLNRWFGFRLDSQCTVVVIVASLLSVVLSEQGSIDVGLLGFALVYVLQLGGLFQYACRQSAEVEDAFTAVERLHRYAELEPEEGYADEQGVLVTDADVAGKVKVEGTVEEAEDIGLQQGQRGRLKSAGGKELRLDALTVRYRKDLEPRLKAVDLVVPPGTKLGVCGRTGSGKSTMLLALLRLNIVTSGDLLLNGKSLLTDYDLQGHRRQFASIGQEAHFFSGTVRSNLDPFGEHSDEELWAALHDAHCGFVGENALKLDAVVAERGGNYSAGQAQLLSLARAILRLRTASIVLCDEVTASVDYQTDRLIQDTLRTAPAFRDCTIVTIAHRLRTIADYDTVCVVSAGEVAEVGSPADLLKNKGSLFYSLCEESNELGDIMTLAGL